MENSAQDADAGACCGFLNPELLYLKLVYFTYISSMTVVRPYIALFMSELGLSEFQVGLLRSLEPGAILVLSPVWGSIADKRQNRKFLLLLCVFGSAVFLPLLLFIPPVSVSRGQGASLFAASDGSGNLSNGSFAEEEAINSSTEDINIFAAASLFTFALAALISLMDNVFIAGFLPLFDALTMALVQRYPGSSYGGQRWTGALAVVVFSPVVGMLTDWYGGTVTEGGVYFLQSSYVPSFILFTFLVLISIIPTIKTKDALSSPPQLFSRELLVVFRQLHVIITFVVFIVAGACKGLVVAFLFIYLEELGASKFLMSISLVATCAVEVPCLLISSRLIKMFGYEAMICLGLLAYAVRMFAYSILVDPWYVIPIELLHGVCYGILWPACTEYANHIAPDGMTSTMQSLAHAAKAGVGEIIGISVGGLIYSLYGARTLFLQFTAVSVVVLFVYVLDSLYVHWCKYPTEEEASDVEKAAESVPFLGKDQGIQHTAAVH